MDTSRPPSGGASDDPAPAFAGSVRPRRGTETYLFTDIEGSTKLLQRLGERFSDLLVEQRRMLLDVVRRGGGREAGTSGDGSLVVFPSALEAVSAAAAVQRTLAAHEWPEGAQLRLRMGLHSGESEVADEIYTGLDVFRAARIAAAGHGGQVLLSQATRQLVERDLPADLGLRDLGTHLLKDLERPEHLHQLLIDGAPAEFPPLNSIDARPSSLPRQVTPLVGRAQEVETLRALLLRDAVRLVTLSGPGGTGKTRLAIEVARSLDGDFADGVHFVPLGSVERPEGVAPRLAESLGLIQNAARSLSESLVEALRPKRSLLLLDNFEQVVDAGALVALLLAECPELKALVTSRVVLHLSSEYEYQVPPLGVPDPQRPIDVAELARYPSVALFVERAQATTPAFRLTPENAVAVARICAHLDGLPLAIELAAARIKLFTVHAMVARLGSRLELLKGGARDLPLRQRTLRGAIDWSHDLLKGDEQALLRRLSVFAGGATFEAVEDVAHAPAALKVELVEALSALIDNSLLRRIDDGGEGRFVMLETIREYALERLQAAGDEDAARAAHALHFAALAKAAEQELAGSEQGRWLDRLEVEHDNLRAALASLQRRGEHAAALELGAALWRFWVSRGYLREGRERLLGLLRLPRAQQPSIVRARALHGVGTIEVEIGEHARGRELLLESLAISRSLGDAVGVAISLNGLAWSTVFAGDVDEAERIAEEATAHNSALGDPRGIAVAAHNRAWIALRRGRYAEAGALMREAIELRRAAGDRRGEAYMRVNLAEIELRLAAVERAAELVEQAAAELRALGDRQIGAWGTQVQGHIAHDLGDDGRSIELFEEAAAVWRELGSREGLAWTLADLAEALRDAGEEQRSLRAAEEAEVLARATGSLLLRVFAFPTVAGVVLGAGDTERASALLEEVLPHIEAAGDRYGEARVLEVRGALKAEGDPLGAVHDLSRADALRRALGTPLAQHAERRVAHALEGLRARLGDGIFAAARDEGAASAVEA